MTGEISVRPGERQAAVRYRHRMRLSLVMPVHDEARTLEAAVRRLDGAGLPDPWELIVVDDGSTDGCTDGLTRAWVPSAARVVLVRSRENRGKGSALRRGLALAQGEILGVQDADLEYDPADIPAIVRPILDGEADVVFGSRQFGANSSYSYWYTLGNRVISTATSMLFDRVVTDAYTCHKFFRRSCFEALRLTADGFDIEAELAGGLLRRGNRYREVPISYAARDRAEGKKIRPRDGVAGVARLVRVRFGAP
jgi:glycosyltransferase involved in cell wall biosynthesis